MSSRSDPFGSWVASRPARSADSSALRHHSISATTIARSTSEPIGSQAIDSGDLFERDSETRLVALGIDWSFLDIGRVRALAHECARGYLDSREALGFPLLPAKRRAAAIEAARAARLAREGEAQPAAAAVPAAR